VLIRLTHRFATLANSKRGCWRLQPSKNLLTQCLLIFDRN
jgi:hypothetical protein